MLTRLYNSIILAPGSFAWAGVWFVLAHFGHTRFAVSLAAWWLITGLVVCLRSLAWLVGWCREFVEQFGTVDLIPTFLRGRRSGNYEEV